MIYIYEDLSEYRKERMMLQHKLIKKYKMPLLSIIFNYMNEKVTNEVTFNIVKCIEYIIADIFSPYIFFHLSREGAEGYNAIFIINRDALELKKISIEIEEKHVLGKCVDIEIYDNDLKKMERQMLGYSKRKCYLCNGDMRKCIENRNHNKRQIIKYAYDKYDQYMKSP
ncbi:citrate lyase holo-[acyl-carrier protein] synthase [Clostridium botulinum]|uniref:citrate lyase holo-[acyl-carrier protein] synthase n=1 Tax=Clostridium botulinum C/D str. DC5 TaxID=1443128 RepID=A0A0A0IHJ6_CLOBO|nr:citrate lyase holo-[acyl-carrier protein] synthase [Clostridium botulinum]KEI04993.1 citX protein [Clostridium botulinum C/D str. BKT75002]KEI11837.1 citX protein [Clostridium botulinum C/D str. BKT2873]KGN00930.1 citX protein [Clostridium botulinum C/D str. DC5]KOC52408.1 citX protein [Clostridium botulinum]KOC55955.1 citX protein [Clostridium botulinum]